MRSVVLFFAFGILLATLFWSGILLAFNPQLHKCYNDWRCVNQCVAGGELYNTCVDQCKVCEQ